MVGMNERAVFFIRLQRSERDKNKRTRKWNESIVLDSVVPIGQSSLKKNYWVFEMCFAGHLVF